ncbi:trans-sialidase [Trypanosoma cruzi]|nr:trans-sialidase [Trypanosoma cruzi]
MQTSSTGTRTSRVVPGHSCGTTRCEGTCYRGAGIKIYLRKHEGGQQRHKCACCSKSALMLSLLRMANAMLRPAPVAMHSHGQVFNIARRFAKKALCASAKGKTVGGGRSSFRNGTGVQGSRSRSLAEAGTALRDCPEAASQCRSCC